MLPSSGKGRHLGGFVNRDDEMQLIQDAFDTLVDSQKPLSTPIIDFFGVDGIGKTRILRRIEHLCAQKNISHLWLDAGMSSSEFARSISRQMKKYTINTEQITAENISASFHESSIQAIKRLLKIKPPVVALLDSVDTSSRHQSDWIETMLRDVTEDTNLCVVLASKQKLSFERDWSMIHKLKLYQLKPLDQNSSDLYLKHVKHKIPEEIRKIIFEWTHGYPLAMNAMIDAYPFDLKKDEDQHRLVDIITKRVIDQEILAKVEPTKFTQYKEALTLLSFPRRFNLPIMQELFPKFAPSLVEDFKSKLAYMALPSDLNRNTNVLYWDQPRAGFTIDQAVRNIFLLEQKIEHPASFYDIHAFLAEKNMELVKVVTGTDRMRYLREYLYHRLYNVDVSALPTIIEEVIRNIGQKSPEEVVQFSEEFAVDEELREALGSNVSMLDAFLKKENIEREGSPDD